MQFLEITDDDAYRQAAELLAGAVTDESAELQLQQKLDAARVIVDQVRQRGDDAVAEFTAKFDGADLRPEQFELSRDEMNKAIEIVKGKRLITVSLNAAKKLKINLKNDCHEVFGIY